ncbi:MAG: CoA transferase, partial [Pseudomonadota bacterium]
AVIVDMPDEEAGRIPMHNVVPRLSDTPGALRTPAPDIGQHNAEILGALGLSDEDRTRLAEEGVI